MKRIIAVLLITICFILCLSACGEPTTYTDKDEYSVGELITIYDNESESQLGQVKITDVSLIDDTPFTEKEFMYYDKNDEPVYNSTTYNGFVLIEYTFSVLDSTKKFRSDNFDVFDCDGIKAKKCDPSDYDLDINAKGDHYFVVAVTEIGEYVDIDIRFHRNQHSITTVKGYYDDSKYVTEVEEESATEDKKENIPLGTIILVSVCLIEFSVIVFLLIMFVFVPRSKQKKLKRQQILEEALREKSNKENKE